MTTGRVGQPIYLMNANEAEIPLGLPFRQSLRQCADLPSTIADHPGITMPIPAHELERWPDDVAKTSGVSVVSSTPPPL